MSEWWQTFFDRDYLRLWEDMRGPEHTQLEVTGLWKLLELQPGNRVLDAPCGYGRIACELAKRGAIVLGIDFSAELVSEAERRRNDIPVTQLRYRRADLREPLTDDAFDVALNLFSSIGYSTEEDDIRVLCTLRTALRPGGRVFIETTHRDFVACLRPVQSPGRRLPDGTLVIEEPRLDALTGRVESTWYWSGPAGAGEKRSSIRAYNATELSRLVETAGLRVQSLHEGCSSSAFVGSGPGMSRRLGLLAIKE